jgi:hypothetical protein
MRLHLRAIACKGKRQLGDCIAVSNIEASGHDLPGVQSRWDRSGFQALQAKSADARDAGGLSEQAAKKTLHQRTPLEEV